MSRIKSVIESDTFKRLTNRKIILGVFAIMLAIVFIAITSFVPFVITKEKLTSEKFWTDELIIIAITIFAMMSALFIGQAHNAQNVDSKIAKAKRSFVESLKTISNVNSFCQWVKKVLQPHDIQSIKEREMRKIGIDDYEILKLSDRQIMDLSLNAQKYDNRYYSQISEKQALTLLDIKDGVKRIHLVEPEYYLTVSSIDTDRTTSEKSGREQMIKSIKLVVSVVSKLLLTLIPAVIFAALARDLSEGAGGDKAEAWATFISRMFALISSSFFGYIIGCQLNDVDADYINLKTSTHKKFLADTDFKPLTQQEIAKEQFIERVKEENKNLISFSENVNNTNLTPLKSE